MIMFPQEEGKKKYIGCDIWKHIQAIKFFAEKYQHEATNSRTLILKNVNENKTSNR